MTVETKEEQEYFYTTSNFSFDELLKEQLLSVEQKERKRGIYYVSDLYKCPRTKYYLYVVENKEMSVDVLRIFQTGHIFHEWIQRMLRKRNMLIASEVEIEYKIAEDIKLIGHYDALINLNGKHAILELKTTRKLPKEALKHHIEQINAYLCMTGIDSGFIVYIEKNTFRTRTFLVEADNRLFLESLTKTKKLDLLLYKGVVPEATFGERWECNYCEFVNLCKKEMRK